MSFKVNHQRKKRICSGQPKGVSRPTQKVRVVWQRSDKLWAWAWSRIQSLRHEKPTPVDEIVRLGEGYSVATEWTSFIVLENDAEYQRWKIDRRNALRVERDRRQSAGLRKQLTAIRDRAQNELGPEAVAKPAAASSDSIAASVAVAAPWFRAILLVVTEVIAACSRGVPV